MNTIPNPKRRVHDFNVEHFRIRLTARLCIILVCLFQYIPRLTIITTDSSLQPQAQLFLIISLPFPMLMILTILFEYFLYKKLGPGIVKYSGFVDVMLLLFFIADWVTVAISYAKRVLPTDPVSFSIGIIYGLITFSWRTLLVTLIVQKWQLKIIAPIVAVMVITGYVIYYSTGTLLYLFLTTGVQLFNIVIIVYCEDKVKWQLVWTNIQQEKWMEVNNFILNSIPENIIILDLAGEAKFVSEYCKSFIEKCNLSLDVKHFFNKIQDLQHQQQSGSDLQSPSSSVLNTERLTTMNAFFADNEDRSSIFRHQQVLEDLIRNFKDGIKTKEIKEQQFLVYNGKLKLENRQDKSLEVKISFVQHFESYYIIVIFRDTTHRDKLITLEETNKYKDQLLASVSHELRAPLNGNINLVESAVNSCQIPEKIKGSLLVPALRSSKFLLHLINDILDMSQIKEKKLRLVFHSGSLKETLKNAAQLVELQAQKKGIALLLEIDPDVPKTFCTDHMRVSQIVLNLLSNAIKFTKEGMIKLTARTMLEEPNLVKISVEDSGIGIGQGGLQKLFASYTHIEFEERPSMNPAGVGLGLNIAHNLAVLLASKEGQGITVSSFPGRGSTFTFILENKGNSKRSSEDDSAGFCPIADEEAGPIQTIFQNPEKLSGENSCSCPKILVVDDNPFNTMAFETILDSLNIKCDSVYSGSSCIKSLRNRQAKVCGDNCKQYSVIFMDQEMPEMNGSETVCEIKRLEEKNLLSQGIKIFGCTAHKSKEEVDKFMEAGLDQCIHKPISIVMIKSLLKETSVFNK